MAVLEVLALVENSPGAGQGVVRAPAAADYYSMPRKLAISPVANDNGLVISGASLTGSNASNLVDLAATWNTSGTPTGFKLNITDTASNAASLLADLQVGGTSKFNIGKSGLITQALSADVSGFASTGYNVTGSGVTALLDLSGTWNTSGIVSAIKLNITNTASNSASMLLNFQVASSTVFSISRTGAVNSTQNIATSGGGFYIQQNNATTGIVAWGSSSDVILGRDGADVLGLRRTTNVQTFNWYGTYTSTTDYHRGGLKAAKATASAVSGASVALTALIPDGAVVIGVTTKVTIALGTGGGTTGYQVGDGSDADRWGDITGTAAGTSSDNTNATATGINLFTAANDVVLTAVGGNFNGTGAIEVCVFYLIAQAD